MIRTAAASLLMLSFCGPALAQARSDSPALDRPDAFEQAFAASSYMFDACGDPLAGRMFRRALSERFAQCPFTPEARSRYQQNTRAQQAKTRQSMDSMIENHGGLPMHLDGMAMTCHEQHSMDAYQEFRDRLSQYAQGRLPATAVIAAPCDASEITP